MSTPPTGAGARRSGLSRPAQAALAQIAIGATLLITTLILISLFGSLSAYATPQLSQIVDAGKAAQLPTATALVIEPGKAAAPAAPATPDAALRAAVERANAAFVSARAQADPAALKGIATGEWLTSEQRYLAGLRARGQTERWQLSKIEFVQVTPQGDSAFVCTRETWQMTTLGPGGAASATRTITLTEGYYLTRPAGEWMVTRIEVS